MSGRPLVLDAPRALDPSFLTDARVRYRSIGVKPPEPVRG